jgi:hypothetical protein
MTLTRTRYLAGLFAAAAMTNAQAQTGAALPETGEPGAQWLTCLTQPAKPPRLPDSARERHLGGTGQMRLALTFERPDAPPQVQLLFNSATQAMQDEALDHLKAYRLPCLPAGASARLVRDVVFDREATPPVVVGPPQLARGAPGRNCIVRPRSEPETLRTEAEAHISKTLVLLHFEGDGEQPPRVEVLYSSATDDVKRHILDYLAQYRAPCRQAGDRPLAVEQSFVFLRGARPATFKEPRVGLDKFMTWVRGAEALQADFDFGTMGCPFRIKWQSRQPHLRNVAWVPASTPTHPGRGPFLAWLGTLQLKLTDAAAEQLFTADLDIDVPCGRLQLPAPG